jgi:hypothetical protein
MMSVFMRERYYSFAHAGTLLALLTDVSIIGSKNSCKDQPSRETQAIFEAERHVPAVLPRRL